MELLPSSPPISSPRPSCLWKCHKSLSPAKSHGGRPGLAAGERRRPGGTPTGTLKLTAQHTSLFGERARLHTLHLQVPPCSIPVSPQEPKGKRPNNSTYREVCEGYTCRGKEKKSGHLSLIPLWDHRGSITMGGEGLSPLVEVKHELGPGRFRSWTFLCWVAWLEVKSNT